MPSPSRPRGTQVPSPALHCDQRASSVPFRQDRGDHEYAIYEPTFLARGRRAQRHTEREERDPSFSVEGLGSWQQKLSQEISWPKYLRASSVQPHVAVFLLLLIPLHFFCLSALALLAFIPYYNLSLHTFVRRRSSTHSFKKPTQKPQLATSQLPTTGKSR